MNKLLVAAIPIVVCQSAMASYKYNLPMTIECNGEETSAIGVGICSQDSYPSFMKVKIPPTRGQLRVVDCQEDLTRDKNPDDFNMQIEKSGWWIFSRKVRVVDSTPKFDIPRRSYNDCAIVATVTGEKTGTQMGVVLYDTRKYSSSSIETSCAAEPNYYSVDKMTLCRALAGARLGIRAKGSQGKLLVGSFGSSRCNIKQEVDLSKKAGLTIPLPEGLCVVDVAWVKSKTEVFKSRIITVGDSRETRELDNPLMVKEGNGVRIYKPNGASMVSTEIYSGDSVVWRSGPRDNDSFTLDPQNDNSPGKKVWDKSWTMCITAYSDTLNSTSGVCYRLSDFTEAPYYFFK